MSRCPHCGAVEGERKGPGDWTTCLGCGSAFWSVDGSETGRPVTPRESPAPSRAAVWSLHAGVLAAEAVLAAFVLCVFLGLPAWALARWLDVL